MNIFKSSVFNGCAAVSFALLLLFASQATGQDSDVPKDPSPEIDRSLLGGLTMRNIGPALMSGRIGDIAVDPEDTSTWYLGVASGGVWKTTNAGTTWQPIFENQSTYSIGCVAIDPQNRHCIWVGSGENNSQRSVGYGDGVYKSDDGGRSFQHVGLESSEHIAKIIVHPKDSDVVFVASQGPLWKEGGQRGLYKTKDGGKSWELVLEISKNTGITDFVLDPRDPDCIYAASYQRRRHQWVLIDGGPESTIYKSTDGGESWKKISRGLPSGDLGRIGLAISPVQPDVLYATVEAASGSGFYRSANRGETWSRQSSYVSSSPQYYQEIVADPNMMDRVYALDTYLQVTEDGGKTFQSVGERFKHVDNHALYIDPLNSDHLLVGCDGGLYESFDRGDNYKYFPNLPITQFYKIAVDNSEPFYYVYGGTQDNATQGGPSETDNVHGIRNSDWFITVFGDGFDPAVDPNDPNTVYSQWQYGGLVRYDRTTGETTDIKPQESADGPALRWNWDSALHISPHNSHRIYYASQILFMSEDRGDSWKPISEDLTRNLDRNQLKVMGRVWSEDAVAKNTSTSFYGTIVTISESPLVPELIYVGTDDGLVQVTEDGGKSWRKIEQFKHCDVPEFAYVSDIEASKHDPDSVYVVAQNFKRGDFKPYLLKSEDRGQTWRVIQGDLPENGPAFCIAEDGENEGLLFAGTEFGAFVTLDDGEKWLPLPGLPTIAVRDLEIQARENDLVLGTFGRGIYILDDYSMLRHVDAEALKDSEATIFPISTAKMYVPARPMAGGQKAYQGSSFFVADNPEFGATIRYHLKDSIRSEGSKRKQEVASASRSGRDTPYPSWETLKAEDREESPANWMVIRDDRGDVIRRLRASGSAGTHSLVWNFRLTGLTPHQIGSPGFGPMALPGTYSAQLVHWDGEEFRDLTEPVEFECVPLRQNAMDQGTQKNLAKFRKDVGEVQRVLLAANSVLSDAQNRIRYMKSLVEQSPQVDLALREDVRKLELQLMDLDEVLSGDPTKPRRSEPEMPGLLGRLQNVVGGIWSAQREPTGTHRQNLKIVKDAMPDLLSELRTIVERKIPDLDKKFEEAKAPWTPGRKLPNWK